jgi:rRNA maturation endonuclease Nob1
MESRNTDTTIVECEDCGWRGMAKDCYHTYRGYGHGESADVEPIDECPKCGSWNLIDPDMELAKV